jgi:hypothetical protein
VHRGSDIIINLTLQNSAPMNVPFLNHKLFALIQNDLFQTFVLLVLVLEKAEG